MGRYYERALGAALGYAEANRRLMLEQAAAAIERHFPAAMRWDEAVNIHHNDATCERHYDTDVWVHRKGAVKAAAGQATITPGRWASVPTWAGEGQRRVVPLVQPRRRAGAQQG